VLTNNCGTCTACCKVYAIPELEKPAGKWCDHCEIGKSCKIYETRPQRCVEYECLWLQSQKDKARLGPELRPDKCKIVFSATTNPRIITGITMPGAPFAYQRKDVAELIEALRRRGIGIAIGVPAGRTNLFLHPNGTQKTVKMTEPDKDGMQWSISEV
jgi:hypothetical protein